MFFTYVLQRAVLIATVVGSVSTTVGAQLQTIPEMLERAAAPISSGPTIPSGVSPSIDAILGETDVIIRGIVGEPHSYLSEDQLEVYTDYPIVSVSTLLQLTDRISPVTTVTILGGTISVKGLTYTSTHAALPELELGRDYLLMLRRSGSHYFLAGRYLGAFAIIDDGLWPATKKPDFATDLRGASASREIPNLIRRAGEIRNKPR